jgi:hypothetical protein
MRTPDQYIELADMLIERAQADGNPQTSLANATLAHASATLAIAAQTRRAAPGLLQDLP